MFNFKCDYAEGAHPSILQKLVETNVIQEDGYGADQFSLHAKKIIREKLNNSKAEIYFVSGGTQANLLVISSILQVHEAVISVATGHIFTHETGAIEASGHRVITVPGRDGKVYPSDLEEVLKVYSMRPHMVKPRLVYISNSTEIGTIYSKLELEALYEYCQKCDLLLFMDGARLGQALMSADSDLRLEDLSKLTDIFYLGGTKNGALLGEAIVFNQPEICPHFDYALKQKGALLAKGRVLGAQFLALFEDELYFKLAKHANDQAQKIAEFLKKRGITFLMTTQTNQVFPILPVKIVKQLHKHYSFYDWKIISEDAVAIRLITSWATPNQAIDKLIEDLEQLL